MVRWWLSQPAPKPERAKTHDEVLGELEEPPADFDPFGEEQTQEPKDVPETDKKAPSGQKRKRSPSPSPERETCPEKIEQIVAQMERQNKMSNNSSLPEDTRADAKKMVAQLRKRLPKGYKPVIKHFTKTKMSAPMVVSTTAYCDQGAGNLSHGFGSYNYSDHGGSGAISIEDGQDDEAERFWS